MNDNDFDEFPDDPDYTPTSRDWNRGVMRTPENFQKYAPKWNNQPVRSMSSDHIMSAILWCERKFVTAQENFVKAHMNEFTDHHYKDTITGMHLVRTAGDQAREAFYFKNVADMYPDYTNLRNEWYRRNNQT